MKEAHNRRKNNRSSQKLTHSFSLQPRYYSNSNDNSHCRSGGRFENLGSNLYLNNLKVKFNNSEKATKFCQIFTLLLSYVVPVKSKVMISQNFVAFSEYMNFIFSIYLIQLENFCSTFASKGFPSRMIQVLTVLQSHNLHIFEMPAFMLKV